LTENIPEENCTKESNGYPCFIPAQRTLNLVSKKWGIQLIHLLQSEKHLRYNEIKESLQKGWTKKRISDATLSDRLSDFVNEGLIIREVYPEIPPKVEYFLSQKGKKLAKALEPLIEWAVNVCHSKSEK
jgi:DNA-binding HxlR family transcriptional regulator